MHKTPVASRFITAGNDTILSELSSINLHSNKNSPGWLSLGRI